MCLEYLQEYFEFLFHFGVTAQLKPKERIIEESLEDFNYVLTMFLNHLYCIQLVLKKFSVVIKLLTTAKLL